METTTNAEILNYLKDFRGQVSAEIKTASEDSAKLLNEKLKDMDKKMDEKLEKVKKNVTTELRIDIKAGEENVNRMGRRLDLLEEEMRRSKYQRMKTNTLKQMANDLQDQPTGRIRNTAQNPDTDGGKVATRIQPNGNKDTEIQHDDYTGGNQNVVDDSREHDATSEHVNTNKNDSVKTFSSQFARKMEDELNKIQKQLQHNQIDKDVVQVLPVKPVEMKSKQKSSMKKLMKWFGDDSEDSSSSDSSDSSEENSWTEVRRFERNKEKKTLMKKKLREKMSITAEKARHIIGVSPLCEKTIAHHRTNGRTYEEAKCEAIREYLSYFLDFTSEEIDNMEIKETYMAANGDDTLYVAFANIDSIREIHYRLAECRNSNIHVRNYIPPQYYERYMHLNAKCADYRKDNPEIKTQLRFGQKDIEILMKTRGSVEPFRIVPMNTVDNKDNIPKFDCSRKWKIRTGAPLRRKKNYNPEKDKLPSMAGQLEERDKATHSLSRTSSLKDMRKKQKTNKLDNSTQDSPNKPDNTSKDNTNEDVNMDDPLSLSDSI